MAPPLGGAMLLFSDMLDKLRMYLHTSDIRAYPLYSATIFLSAFLLFQVQPMVARYLLPFFGGAVSVWAASLVFFTGVLFFGYAYVYGISGLAPRTQVRIHLGLLALAAITTLCSFVFNGGTFLPVLWALNVTDTPTFQVLLALTAIIGIPYGLLSTTGPLLQHWYAGETGKEPYHLYALSNTGSLLALASYPFLIEPAFGLATQERLWSTVFFLCIALTGVLASRHTQTDASSVAKQASETVPASHVFAWMALASLPTALLVATTTRITQTLTPFPFLWIIPLSLYLVSFILAFRGWGGRGCTPFTLLVAGLASYAYLDWNFDTAVYQMVANLALFFFGALYCHALLYRLRPAPVFSSFFYFWISLGGAVGTLVVTLIAPVVFVGVSEFPIGMFILAVLAIATFPAMTYIRDEFARGTLFIKRAILVCLLLCTTYYASNNVDAALESSRNFFGVVHVYEYGEIRSLQHGTTMHGYQFTDPARSHEPTTYYSPTSGVGRAIIQAKANHGKDPISVGIIGLGAGTIAAYCEKGDTFKFYEIDERIGRIAREYFTYLTSCEGSSIVYGDGRLTLTREHEQGTVGNFDVLAVDAFSDDTIPIHLLTKEAVELYMSHLSSEGVLAIHTSNRFFELSPIVMRIVVELGLSAMVITDSPETEGATLSQWVLLARRADTLQKHAFADAANLPPPPAALWTDDYANVFAALDWSALSVWK